MNIQDIQDVASEVLALLSKYHNPPKNELSLDAIFFAYMKGRSINVSRQFGVSVYGQSKPKRIDFRVGGSNPVVVEFACRSTNTSASLSGSQNVSELRKLCRVSAKKAKLRALLLLDAAKNPQKKHALKETYDKIHAGPGKFERTSVRVIYVHRQSRYDFLWHPYQA